MPYFHVVFTLPEELAHLALQNKRVIYNLLFQSAAQTLLKLAAEPKHLGAQIGFLAVLHTWSQQLRHIRICIVWCPEAVSHFGQRWVSCRANFFLPVKVLSRLFRRLFRDQLGRLFAQGKLSFHGSLTKLNDPVAFQRFLHSLGHKEWVVYAKPPFGGPRQVLDYLGRFTHRVAISNHRLLKLEHGQVTFSCKDYRHGQRRSLLTLTAEEFMRRFLLHTLPRGFQRLRHFGLLSNRTRVAHLAHCRQLLGVAQLSPSSRCPPQDDAAALFQALTGDSHPLPGLSAGAVAPTRSFRTTVAMGQPSQHRHQPSSD